MCLLVCFGDKPSPSIANYSMMRIATSGKKEYPRGSVVIENKRYVDDLLDSSSNFEEMLRKRDETQALLGRFGFEIKRWQSNHPDIGEVKGNNKVLGARWDAEKGIILPS